MTKIRYERNPTGHVRVASDKGDYRHIRGQLGRRKEWPISPVDTVLATRGRGTPALPLEVDRKTRLQSDAGSQEWKRMRALGRDLESAKLCGGFLQGTVQPSAASMMHASLNLRVLRPELTGVQAKHKTDLHQQEQEAMKLYQAYKMSPPSPLLGCLPIQLPMAILSTLFFQSTIESCSASFM